MTTKKKLKQVLAEMRRLVRDQRFEFTGHCIRKSLPDDGFTATDALTAILNGWIEREEYDLAEALEKYVIYGYALDQRGLGVVARFGENETGEIIVIITSYEILFEVEDED